MKKVAFVIHRYGQGVLGGAEIQCRAQAIKLKEGGVDTEILTTCAGREWTDSWKEGVYEEDGLIVRRFKTTKRNYEIFYELDGKIRRLEKLTKREQELWMQNHCTSEDLVEFIREHKNEYAAFLFLPYLYGTTYFGSRVVKEKAIIIPCLHTEPHSRLDIFKKMLQICTTTSKTYS